ncbi:MAG TPA: alpha-amylase [Candidatus Lachnoclostridium pullistercoris]|uniref:Alpha-amylase n=1 Tax=Candidatus Lachnoclostridium pullistercoris TaxID=2838632 RepID=A0A9D2PE88_9FIRM|nr:alpha-amylase [Candidatus Lachnoclostridium pullistercoris]
MGDFYISENKKWYPLGAVKVRGGYHFATTAGKESCALVLYRAGREKPVQKIFFREEDKTGDVWNMTLTGGDFQGLEYAYEADGTLQADPYGLSFDGRDKWGSLTQVKKPLKTPLEQEEFDWEGDRPLEIPYEDTVIYRLHVRGFTKHSSSGTEEHGTFSAIAEKIPYLKDLGVTAVELLPPVEFEEVMVPEGAGKHPYVREEPTGKLNYWGYGKSCVFAPKASYSSGREKHPVKEFKELVKSLHKAGLEIIVELYFTGAESPVFALDAVRSWVEHYHVDGVHLVGNAPLKLIGEDPFLSRTKLIALSWDGVDGGRVRHLGEYNDGFLEDSRRLLKGDEGQINQLVFRLKRNPKDSAAINYIASTNGFTLMDMVSYDRKHNEANGENGRDGTDSNYSWNCGVEGPTRKKKVLEMRKKQIRNALLLVFLSQGTPLLMAGDEFGNSQGGNNNAYCQDNETSWLNWNLLKTNSDIHDFVKFLIGFRKAHPMFHMSGEPKVMDYKVCGYPDVSFHGVKAWCPEFENFRRQLGVLYCGEYGLKPDGTADDFFYVIYNMHWEPHEFALPHLPKDRKWLVAVNSDDAGANGFYSEGEEKAVKDQKRFMAAPRSIVVLVGKKMPETETEKKEKPSGGKKKSAAEGKKEKAAAVKAAAEAAQKKAEPAEEKKAESAEEKKVKSAEGKEAGSTAEKKTGLTAEKETAPAV